VRDPALRPSPPVPLRVETWGESAMGSAELSSHHGFTVLDLRHITPSYGQLTLASEIGTGGAHATGGSWLGVRARAGTWAAVRPGCLRPRPRLLPGREAPRARGRDPRRDRSCRPGVSLGAPTVALGTLPCRRPGHRVDPGRSGADLSAYPLVLRTLVDRQRDLRRSLRRLGDDGAAARRSLRRRDLGVFHRRNGLPPLSQRVLADLHGVGGLPAGRQPRSPRRPAARQCRLLSHRPLPDRLSPPSVHHGLVPEVRVPPSRRLDPST